MLFGGLWLILKPKSALPPTLLAVMMHGFRMAKNISHQEFLSFLWSLPNSSVNLPTLTDDSFTITCELGRGLTSRVFCVKDKDKKCHWVLKLPKPDRSVNVRIVAKEATIMKEMGMNSAVRENPHLAKFVDKVSVTFQNQAQQGILLFPPATNEKVRLTLEDVTELAGALYDLHEAGYLHRDVSPANIGHYYDGDSQCRPFLRDFGFAVALIEKDSEENVVEGEERREKLLPFAGTVVSASNSILRALSNGKTEIVVGRRDDLDSLCKSLILLARGSRVHIDEDSLAGKARSVLDFWNERASIDEDGLNDILHSDRYKNIRRYFMSLPSRPPRGTSLAANAHTPPLVPIQTPSSFEIPSPPKPSTPFAQSPFFDRKSHPNDSAGSSASRQLFS